MDILFMGIVVAFFVLTWGLLILCRNLGEQKPGERP
jgi:hypothetical protein